MNIIKTKVHTIRMADVEDPDLFVAEPIYHWQQTDAGKFIMNNSKQQPEWHRRIDTYNYGYQYDIIAYLEEKDLTFYRLKYE
jgi:hypothetical protein